MAATPIFRVVKKKSPEIRAYYVHIANVTKISRRVWAAEHTREMTDGKRPTTDYKRRTTD